MKRGQMGEIEAVIEHLRLTKNCIKADARIRQRSEGSIPCPCCIYGGTINYRYDFETHKIYARCDSGKCVTWC